MDFASNRISRNVLTVLAVAAAVVVVWFLLTFLLKFAGRFANGIALTLLLITAIFLIVLVLIQRGKGGGLAGAFGGLGGQSAFGTKAGDLFTRVTIGAALFWIVLCMVTVNVLGTPPPVVAPGMGGSTPVKQKTSSSSSGKKSEATPPQKPAGRAGPSGGQSGGP